MNINNETAKEIMLDPKQSVSTRVTEYVGDNSAGETAVIKA